MKTWEQLEKEAFDGTIDLNGIEEPEKRAYFASLEQLYLAFRAGAIDRISAERKKAQTAEEIAEKACAIVGLLTGEDSFAPRQIKKIRKE